MKFFRNILELFTKNWWLKLIALLLAIIIYHTTKTDTTRNQNRTAHDRPLIQIH